MAFIDCQMIFRQNQEVDLEFVAAFVRYPTNAEYVQVAKLLIVKYPFLRDMEGNGYVSFIFLFLFF